MRSALIKETLLLPFRRPVLLVWALVSTAILYLVNRQANIYDISNPRWVITMAAIILLSPLFSGGFILLLQAQNKGEKLSVSQAIIRTFSTYYSFLIAGEFLVNIIVIAGGILFVIPGIYFGLRLIFYKQEILIGGARGTAALKMSIARTRKWRDTMFVFSCLALFYLPTIAVFFVPMSLAWDVYALVVSTLTFAWTNILLTRLYMDAESPLKTATTSSI